MTVETVRVSASIAGVWLLSLANSASAYLDPGTGSMILQAAAAGLVTAAVVFRRQLSRIVSLFRRKPRD